MYSVPAGNQWPQKLHVILGPADTLHALEGKQVCVCYRVAMKLKIPMREYE